MTLKKAIEILSYRLPFVKEVADLDMEGALKLLIEAGKRLQDQRLSFRPINLDLLPGETED